MSLGGAERGWRVSLNGTRRDLGIAAREFGLRLYDDQRGPQEISFFSCDEVTEALSAREARSISMSLVEEWNAALSLEYQSFKPLEAGDYVQEVLSTGEVLHTTGFVTPGDVIVSCDVSSPIVTGGREAVARRSMAQRAKAFADHNSEFRDALRLFAMGKNDYRLLYIVLEYIRDGVSAKSRNDGKKWDTLKERAWVSRDQLQLFKVTANDKHRHKPRPRVEEMPLEQAQQFIHGLLKGWLNEMVPS